jgi:hypothetical protein
MANLLIQNVTKEFLNKLREKAASAGLRQREYCVDVLVPEIGKEGAFLIKDGARENEAQELKRRKAQGREVRIEDAPRLMEALGLDKPKRGRPRKVVALGLSGEPKNMEPFVPSPQEHSCGDELAKEFGGGVVVAPDPVSEGDISEAVAKSIIATCEEVLGEKVSEIRISDERTGEAARVKFDPLTIPGVVRGFSNLGNVSEFPRPDEIEEQPELVICSYRERDLERGVWVHCGLPEHDGRKRHGNWKDDGSLYE